MKTGVLANRCAEFVSLRQKVSLWQMGIQGDLSGIVFAVPPLP